ncbi:hypothetical protein CYMTET_14268 [Cymbomonas tetramitiformis]|uniref:Uncharacterized protein n=1 Tax=Cymbomonas tetramitiformis TaxID=36881 RepID=A0AAE0LA63_9CHLO|nr:hypothetical protein CYMTET_14268 [Cymbomonas tetramitiformis]
MALLRCTRAGAGKWRSTSPLKALPYVGGAAAAFSGGERREIRELQEIIASVGDAGERHGISFSHASFPPVMVQHFTAGSVMVATSWWRTVFYPSREEFPRYIESGHFHSFQACAVDDEDGYNTRTCTMKTRPPRRPHVCGWAAAIRRWTSGRVTETLVTVCMVFCFAYVGVAAATLAPAGHDEMNGAAEPVMCNGDFCIYPAVGFLPPAAAKNMS